MDDKKADQNKSEFVDALQKGLLLGVALLVLVLPPLRMAQSPRAPAPPTAVATAPQAVPAPQEAPAPAPESPANPRSPLRLADFNGEDPSPEVRHVANWAHHVGDHKQQAFVIVDKKDARVYVFGPDGKLRESAPALLGSAHGDHSVPGIGDKPLSAITAEEKTTPAGRFKAEPGLNAGNEDVVWVDYDAAVSMHRIRPLVAAERRLERLASLTVDDNRISFGCINLPVSFYENVLVPAVKRHGAVIYVLPETKSPQQLFGSFDVEDVRQLAQRNPRRT
ncbi:murein L,D-transpeptidase [Caenimonas sedimenti]|uniref:Murein L,D-transpeptidase n=1 Tax=Caenimonas sedimenti TaxID=2596921 RepID=A0A562ZLE1_9BURK|nr:murein L,D-transpeptidase [Caenimonas sedimenti]TWO69399.1 murein L,D-transpeptidase [Caenimonas sedimenti]